MNKLTMALIATTAVAVSGGGAAFTNTNSVAASKAGIGAEAVSGITVTDLDYTVLPNATSGEDEISVVEFTSDATMAGQRIVLRLKGASGVLTAADNVADTDVCTITTTRASCAFLATTRADLVAVTSVEVVAYDNDAL